MEGKPQPEIPTPEEMVQKLKYANVIPVPPEKDFPNYLKIREEFPGLCDEECLWMFYGLLDEYWKDYYAQRRTY